MKRFLKLSSLLICISLIFMLFTGCDAIKTMRENQGYFTEKGIELNGKIYIPFAVETPYFSPPEDEERYISATANDVPVLLSSILGKTFSLSKDGAILIGDFYDDGKDSVEYYILEEKYDEITAKIQNGFVISGFEYQLYDWWNDNDIIYNFTDVEIKAVISVLSTEPQLLTGPVSVEYDEEIYITAYSADRYFKNENYTICVYKGAYYILEYDEEFNPTKLYAVPTELSGVFKEIVDSYVEKNSQLEEYE